MPMILGRPAPFGIVDPLPMEGFPPGKTRIRMREDDFVRVWVRTPEGIREFCPVEERGRWVPGIETGRNVSVAPVSAPVMNGSEDVEHPLAPMGFSATVTGRKHWNSEVKSIEISGNVSMDCQDFPSLLVSFAQKLPELLEGKMSYPDTLGFSIANR